MNQDAERDFLNSQVTVIKTLTRIIKVSNLIQLKWKRFKSKCVCLVQLGIITTSQTDKVSH